MARIDDFKLRFPCFDECVVDSIFPAIEPVTDCYFCGNYDDLCDREIIMQLWAHLLTVENAPNAETRRNISSKTVDGVSVSYESSNAAGGAIAGSRNGFFNSTRFGQQFLFLTSRRGGAVCV